MGPDNSLLWGLSPVYRTGLCRVPVTLRSFTPLKDTIAKANRRVQVRIQITFMGQLGSTPGIYSPRVLRGPETTNPRKPEFPALRGLRDVCCLWQSGISSHLLVTAPHFVLGNPDLPISRAHGTRGWCKCPGLASQLSPLPSGHRDCIPGLQLGLLGC